MDKIGTNQNNTVDHSGEIHERLTILYRGEDYIAPKSGKKKQRYYCSCSCGKYTKENPKLIVYESIKSGLVKSCGCMKSELIGVNNKKRKKYNAYDLSGEYGIGYTSKGEEFYFDLEDYDKIKNYTWRKDDNGYIRTTNEHRENISMHRLIMNFPNNKFHIDHIHGNKTRYDNRKSNLRIVTCSQNQMNRGLQSNNKSGMPGVYRKESRDIWEVYITVQKQQIYLGSYKKLEDAIKVRKEAEEKYFGEFSYNNSMNRIG